MAQDSTNLNATIEHNYVSNMLKGGNQTHRLATLSQMYHTMAMKVRDAHELEGRSKGGATTTERPISILENLPLAEEHLVFKWVSIDPNVKCSDILASINVKKVSAAVITSMMIALRDTLPMFGLEMRMATSDVAGCNWVSFWDTLLTNTFRDALPQQILDKYSGIDYNVRCLMKDPVTGQWCIFIPDMPHLTKNIVKCLKLSSSSKSKLGGPAHSFPSFFFVLAGSR